MVAQVIEDKATEQRRLAWRCRRGMLELDIVLQRFVANQFTSLSMDELSAFDAMLELPDNAFWALISQEKTIASDVATQSVIDKFKQH